MGITDIVSFEGSSVDELERDFREGVEDYLEMCQDMGKEPEKPFSGKVMVRMPSELHCALAVEAKRQKKSINTLLIELCRNAVEVPV